MACGQEEERTTKVFMYMCMYYTIMHHNYVKVEISVNLTDGFQADVVTFNYIL